MARDNQTPEQWARTAELAAPVRWGTIEDEVLSRRPTVERSPTDTVIRGIGLFFTILLIIPTFGSSIVGLVLFWLGVDPRLVRLLFAIAASIGVTMLIFWWEDRDRSPVKLLVSGGTGAVSLLTYLLMRRAPEAAADAWAALLMLIAAAIGLGGMAVMLIAAKPGRRPRSRRRRWSLSPAKDLAYVQARQQVLDILVERRQVELDTDQHKRMAQMALGTWHTLDAAPPGNKSSQRTGQPRPARDAFLTQRRKQDDHTR